MLHYMHMGCAEGCATQPLYTFAAFTEAGADSTSVLYVVSVSFMFYIEYDRTASAVRCPPGPCGECRPLRGVGLHGLLLAFSAPQVL